MSLNKAFTWQIGEHGDRISSSLSSQLPVSKGDDDGLLSNHLSVATDSPSLVASNKGSKFGRFMGNILLQRPTSTASSYSTSKVATTSTTSTTTRLYPGYARAERRRKPETDKGENLFLSDGAHWLRMAPKVKYSNSAISSSSSSPSPHEKIFRSHNGKRTRWDVQKNVDKDPLECLHSTSNANSLKPLSFGLRNDEDSCQHCHAQAMNRQSLDIVELCERCKKKWKMWPKIFFSLLQDSAQDTFSKTTMEQEQQPMNTMEIAMPSTLNHSPTDKKTTTAKGAVRRRRAANLPPPTRSRNTHKLNALSPSANHSTDTTDGATPIPVTILPPHEDQLCDKTTESTLTFHHNTFGYTYQQKVQVLNINGHWYSATLVEIDGSKIKVRYKDWDDQDEWILLGSRRLRTTATNDDKQGPGVRDSAIDGDDGTDNDDDGDDASSTMSDYLKDSGKHSPDSPTLTASVTTPLDEPDPQTLTGQIDLPIPATSNQPKAKPDEDYVSSTLDTDPTKIFNNNEVFMTRRMARQMVDEHGFCPNSFGYQYGRAVAATYDTEGANKRKQQMEWVGYLRQMRGNKVRIWFPSSQQSDWMPTGSRRLRLLSDQEDAHYRSLGFDITGDDGGVNNQKAPSKPSRRRCRQSTTKTDLSQAQVHHQQQESALPFPADIDAPSPSIPRPEKEVLLPMLDKLPPADLPPSTDDILHDNKPREATMDNSVTSKPKGNTATRKPKATAAIRSNKTTKTSPKSRVSPKPRDSPAEPPTQEFLTTGAFATRRAMRQLQDEHGFVPNPYGYVYDLAVEILNTKSSKHEFFWERGKLVGMRPGKVRVRYDGWGEVYDEWMMVGSRRIRLAQPTADTAPSTDDMSTLNQHTSSSCTLASSSLTIPMDNNSANPPTLETNFLLMETNPELEDQVKSKKRQRRILGPDDYHRLGMMVSIEELEAKERKRQKRREEQLALVAAETLSSADGHLDANDNKDTANVREKSSVATARKVGTKQQQRRQQKRKQRRRRQSDLYLSDSNEEDDDLGEDDDDDDDDDNPDTPQQDGGDDGNTAKEDDPNHGFVANVYGYDFMQHVQLLHLDNKWYEGRLISMDRNRLRVHYCGWPDLFDEYVTVGSRRLQMVENDHEVQCIEPGYMDRYQDILKNKHLHQAQHRCNSAPSASSAAAFSTKLRRLTLNNVGDENPDDDPATTVACRRCEIAIKQFRYYCTYCESSIGEDELPDSFNLCLQCFDHNFPFWHEHPRSSFAVQSVIDTDIGPRPIKGELVTIWEEDVVGDDDFIQAPSVDTTLSGNQETAADPPLAAPATPISTPSPVATQSSNSPVTPDTAICQLTPSVASTSAEKAAVATSLEVSQIFPGQTAIGLDQGYKYLKRWQRRKVCAFCNDDDDTSEDLGKFIGPFVITSINKNGALKKRSFWVHDACARHSPEVFCTPEGKWYNVTLALRRGRGVRCFGCKEKGATIGCFESKCNKSFHLPCAQRPVTYFENGVIFWCPTHEAYYNKIDTYVNVFSCDGCNKKLEEDSWYTCLPCASSYFSSFDLCANCYENFPNDHAHDEDQFEETSFEIIKEMEAQKATEVARAREEVRENNARNRRKPTFMKRKRRRADGTILITCCYCGIQDAEEWRKGYDGGVLMCVTCYDLALLVDNDGRPSDQNDSDQRNNLDSTDPHDSWPIDSEQPHQYLASIDEYTHKPYLTRDALSATKFSDSLTGVRLATYEPQPNQLFSLIFDSTYYDIPGRAPRWASHSGTDYHGTWLPQTVRRSISKYTKKNERILSNFLGRGTDAIECFLLQRRCTGIDINPAAVTLSQRNCCFELPIGITEAKYRPIVAQADARNLSGPLFGDESFHHILSHPPYKDCVAYSTHLEGDLSRFNNIDDFKVEYENVVKQSWRVLKMGRRLTLGIGDNREHCFYIPVSFQLMRQYINEGFEMEELIVKRQRYCSAFGLGTYLCVQFDFLVFTHEFLATFRKVPREKIDVMARGNDDLACGNSVQVTRTVRGVPSSAILRKSVVMGTVWVFKPKEQHSFSNLCMSRMVERFGKDGCNWQHVQFAFMEAEDNVTNRSSVLVPSDEEGTGQENQPNTKDDSALSNYEQERLRRIDENNKILLKLGLVSELGEESEDTIHYDNMMNKPSQDEAPLCIVVIEHPEANVIKVHQINGYRRTIVEAAIEACQSLAPLGMFIVGTQDIRDPDTGKLWPLSMLILEDIEGAVDRSILKLKEMVVTVPDGHSRDRKLSIAEAITQYQQQEEDEGQKVIVVDEDNGARSHDHLPIVHAIYLVFQRLQVLG